MKYSLLFLLGLSTASNAVVMKNVTLDYKESGVTIDYSDSSWGRNTTGIEIYTCADDSTCNDGFYSVKVNTEKTFDINQRGIFKINFFGEKRPWYGSTIKNTVVWEQLVVVLEKADESLKSAVIKHAPFFSFFSDESYFPVTIDDLFNRWISDFDVESISKKDYTSSDKINDFMRSNGHMNSKIFMKKDIAKSIAGDKNNFPVYWYVETEGDTAYVTYFTLYAFDQKFNKYLKGGVGESKGEHSVDRESLTVKFLRKNNNWIPEGAIYAGHLPDQPTTFLGCENIETCSKAGNLNTKWSGGKTFVSWSNIAKIGNSPVAYIAHGSHAVTPAFGWYYLHVPNFKCALLNDACDVTEPAGSKDTSSFKKGYLEEIDLNTPKHSALTYSGYLIQGANESYRVFPFIRNPVELWASSSSENFNTCIQNKQGCEKYLNQTVLPIPLKITLDEKSISDIGGTINGNVSFTAGYNGGKAAKFNGVNDPASIRIPNSDNMKFDTGATFDMWARLDSMTGMDGFGRIVSNGQYGMTLVAKSHDRLGAAFMGSGSGILYPQTWDGTWSGEGCISYLNQLSSHEIGKWFRATFTVSPTSGTKTYFNKKLVYECPNARPNFAAFNSQDLFIGKFSDYWYPLNGAIQDISIYKAALTDEQVQALQ